MQVENYYSDDYAGLDSGNLKFYYGYEVTDLTNNEMWCFQVKKDGLEIYRATQKEIQNKVRDRQLNDVRDYLIAGIGMWLLLR